MRRLWSASSRLSVGSRGAGLPVSFIRMTASTEISDLRGQAVLITGGARRVGAALVRALHAAGANILVHYRSSSGAAIALADELNRVRPESIVTHAANLLEGSA